MNNLILKVLHEEPLNELSLKEIRGGGTCVCNNGASFSCNCFSNYCSDNTCTCNLVSSLDCSSNGKVEP